MSTRKASFTHKLTSVILFLFLICVAWLLVHEWRQIKLRRPSAGEPGKEVAGRDTNEPSVPGNTAQRAQRGKPVWAREKPKEKPKAPAVQPRPGPVPTPPTPSKSEEAGPGSKRTVRLADGREVTFGGLTFGLEHRYVHDKPAPAPTSSPQSQKLSNHVGAVSIKTPLPSLVVWLHSRGARESLLEADYLSVVDEAGKEGEMTNPSALFNSAESETMGAWQISNFPRRDARIGIRLYSRDSSYKFHRLAEFYAPNPAPQKYAVWPAEDTPIVRNNGNVEYRVLNVLTDETPSRHSPLIRWHKREPKSDWTTSVFKVLTKGQSSTRWKIESIALSDATGNVSVPESTAFMTVGDYLIFSFDRTFWTSETVGKLTTEFTRTSGFSSNELVTFKNVAVPSANKQLTVNVQKPIGGAVLHLQQIARHRPSIRAAQSRWNMELTAALVPERPAIRLSIVEITDQTGRKIPPGIVYGPYKGRQKFLFRLGPSSELLNITFAVQESQLVEFIAPLRKDNALEAHLKIAKEIQQATLAITLPDTPAAKP